MNFLEWLQKNEENEQKLENFRMNLHTFALNSYQRTRPFKEHPQDLMNKWLQRIRAIRDWATKNFPCDLTNLDLAANAIMLNIICPRRERYHTSRRQPQSPSNTPNPHQHQTTADQYKSE